MKNIFNHLKKNWIRHGFETLVVVVGVLIAFTPNNWNEERKQLYKELKLRRTVKEDLGNYLDDITRELAAHLLNLWTEMRISHFNFFAKTEESRNL